MGTRRFPKPLFLRLDLSSYHLVYGRAGECSCTGYSTRRAQHPVLREQSQGCSSTCEGATWSSIVMRWRALWAQGAPPASPSPVALINHMDLALHGRSVEMGRECEGVRTGVGAKSGANREWNNSNREAHTEQDSSPIPRTTHRLEHLENLEQLVGTQGDSADLPARPPCPCARARTACSAS